MAEKKNENGQRCQHFTVVVAVVGNAILNLLHEINFYKIIHITFWGRGRVLKGAASGLIK